MREEQGGNEGQEGGRERPTSGEVGQEQRPLKSHPGGEPSTDTGMRCPGGRQAGLDVSDFPTSFPPGGLMFRLMTSSQSWVAILSSRGS